MPMESGEVSVNDSDIKFLDLAIDCGIYDRGTTKKVLKYLLALDAISSKHFKFILYVQKKGIFSGLVRKLLFKFKPIFDISCTYTTEEKCKTEELTYEDYKYEDVYNAFATYVPNTSYFCFSHNYDKVFNKHQITNCPEQQKLATDLLHLIKRFGGKKGTEFCERRFVVKDALMFFIKNRGFVDSLRFQIFVIYGKGILDGSISRVILDAEVKWKRWKKQGFPKTYGYEEFKKRSLGLQTKNDSHEKQKSASSFLERFLKKRYDTERPTEASLEWYRERAKLFRLK